MKRLPVVERFIRGSSGIIVLTRTGHSVRLGYVRYWAMIASLMLHAGALTVFTGVKMSGRLPRASTTRPILTMQAVERVAAQPKPVPRVERIVTPPPPVPVQQTPSEEPALIAQANEEPRETERRPPQAETVEIVEAVATGEEVGMTAGEVEFFGQKSEVQQVCYVVDCSGSMYGQMFRVKEQLKDSILRLSSNQAFCVVFFMDGQKVQRSGPGLEAATAASKSRAIELIDSIKPGGTTDAAHALRTAMRLKDPKGNAPQVMYFLTDGFDLAMDGSENFVQTTLTLWRTLSPEMLIHTIGFNPEAQDRRMLFTLAKTTGGNYIEVN